MFIDAYRDAVYAVRTLVKNPGFTAIAILTLALGIGANTTVYSVVDALINFPIPGDDPERIVFAFSENPTRNITQNGASMDDFLDWKRESQSFAHFVGGTGAQYNLVDGGEPERIQAFRVSAGFFPMWGRPLTMGRTFRDEENVAGNERVAILSYPYWQQRFGGASDVVGQEISLDAETFTVIGVTAEGFFFPQRNTALWTPLVHAPGMSQRDERGILVMGRLRENVSVEDADAEIATLAARLEREFPETNESWTTLVMTLRENLSSGSTLALTLLYGSITLVLLIACANVSSLLIARASAREKEIALRTSLGAGRTRLVRQLLIESFILAGAGGTAGVIIGTWGIDALKRLLAPDPNIGFITEFMGLHGTVLMHTLAISLGAALVFGLVPALVATRGDLQSTLKEGGKSSAGGGRNKLRGTLVVAEVAMALTLLGTSGALMRAFAHIYEADPGFEPDGLLTLQLALPEAEYAEPASVAAFYREALDNLAAVPGVDAAATTTTLPLTLFPGATGSAIAIEGMVVEDPSNAFRAIDLVVSPGYFEAMQVPILQGRALLTSDIEGARNVAVVSRDTAERFWPDDVAIGKRFRLGVEEAAPWIAVVGVSGDVQTHSHSIRSTTGASPHVFLPLSQHARRDTAVVLRTSGDPTRFSGAARDAVHAIDPKLPVSDIRTMDAVVAQIDTQNTFFLAVLSGLSFIALVLAGVGIYGIISFSVNQRAREIGIRMALGARPSEILMLVIRQGAFLTVLGLAIGITGAVVFVRFMGAELEGIAVSNASGALTFVSVSLVLLFVAQLASFLPARRAVKVDPLTTLRYE